MKLLFSESYRTDDEVVWDACLPSSIASSIASSKLQADASEPPSDVASFTASDFASAVSLKDKPLLIEFYAPVSWSFEGLSRRVFKRAVGRSTTKGDYIPVLRLTDPIYDDLIDWLPTGLTTSGADTASDSSPSTRRWPFTSKIKKTRR